MGKPTSDSLNPTYTVEGKIYSINRKTHVAEVAIDTMNCVVPDVQIASFYCHPFGGEGGYNLPEVGATCHLTFPSDGSRPYVSSFTMPPTDAEGDAGGREEMDPGSFVFTTRDGNFIRLMRGGVLQLGATSLSQRIYLPIQNYVRDLFENYEALSPSGTARWIVEESLTGESKTRYQLLLNETTSDLTPRVIVEVGEFSDEPDEVIPVADNEVDYAPALSYIRVLIKDSEEIEKVSFRITQDGKFLLSTADYFFAKIGSSLRVEFNHLLELISKRSSLIMRQSGTDFDTPRMVMTILESMNIHAASFNVDSEDINLGTNPIFRPVRGEPFLIWLRSVMAAINVALSGALGPLANVPDDSIVLSGVKIS